MTEVGYNALSFALVIIAFMTDTVLILPIIAFPLFITLLTTVLQVISIRIFKKRLLRIAPLHHHFEALGWETPQIVMRY
jgi:phospho-N-acetylmuramoyl-pentapeptide-transferase